MIVFCKIHSVVCRSEPANKPREIVEFVHRVLAPMCWLKVDDGAREKEFYMDQC